MLRNNTDNMKALTKIIEACQSRETISFMINSEALTAYGVRRNSEDYMYVNVVDIDDAEGTITITKNGSTESIYLKHTTDITMLETPFVIDIEAVAKTYNKIIVKWMCKHDKTRINA